MSTASNQYFLSYVKKTTGGGQIDPPPQGYHCKLGIAIFALRESLEITFTVPLTKLSRGMLGMHLKTRNYEPGVV